MSAADVKIVSYLIQKNTIRDIYPVNVNVNVGGGVPNHLIIDKGLYKIGENLYNLTENGLYRFWNPAGLRVQRIVLDQDVCGIEELISSICWIVCHGNSDQSKKYSVQKEKSLCDKLFLTCGYVVLWVKKVLEEKQIKARIVTSLTEDEWNSYDNGHTLLEVFDSRLQKWIVFDIDRHCYFKKDGNPLNFMEFYMAVQEDKYEIDWLSLSDKLDGSNFKSAEGHSYVFAMERFYCSETAIRDWYRRVMQVPMIYEDVRKKYLFSSCENKQRVEAYSSDYQYICSEAWFQLFYS